MHLLYTTPLWVTAQHPSWSVYRVVGYKVGSLTRKLMFRGFYKLLQTPKVFVSGTKSKVSILTVTVSSFDIIRLVMKRVHKFKMLERIPLSADGKIPGVRVQMFHDVARLQSWSKRFTKTLRNPDYNISSAPKAALFWSLVCLHLVQISRLLCRYLGVPLCLVVQSYTAILYYTVQRGKKKKKLWNTRWREGLTGTSTNRSPIELSDYTYCRVMWPIRNTTNISSSLDSVMKKSSKILS